MQFFKLLDSITTLFLFLLYLVLCGTTSIWSSCWPVVQRVRMYTQKSSVIHCCHWMTLFESLPILTAYQRYFPTMSILYLLNLYSIELFNYLLRLMSVFPLCLLVVACPLLFIYIKKLRLHCVTWEFILKDPCIWHLNWSIK